MFWLFRFFLFSHLFFFRSDTQLRTNFRTFLRFCIITNKLLRLWLGIRFKLGFKSVKVKPRLKFLLLWRWERLADIIHLWLVCLLLVTQFYWLIKAWICWRARVRVRFAWFIGGGILMWIWKRVGLWVCIRIALPIRVWKWPFWRVKAWKLKLAGILSVLVINDWLLSLDHNIVQLLREFSTEH